MRLRLAHGHSPWWNPLLDPLVEGLVVVDDLAVDLYSRADEVPLRLELAVEELVVAQPGDLERADAPLAAGRETRKLIGIVASGDDDVVTEAILEHSFEAIDLQGVLSLLAEFHMEFYRRRRAERVAELCRS